MGSSALFSEEEIKFDGFIYRYFLRKQNKLHGLQNQHATTQNRNNKDQIESQLQMYNHMIDIFNRYSMDQITEDVSEDLIQKVINNFGALTKTSSRKRKSENISEDDKQKNGGMGTKDKSELVSEIEFIVDMVTKYTDDEKKQLQQQIEKQNSKLVEYKERYNIEILQEKEKYERLNRLHRKKHKEIRSLRETTAEMKKMLPKQFPKKLRAKFDKKWEDQFAKVQEYIKENGPDGFKTIGTFDPQLDLWVKKQRKDLQVGTQSLTQDKIERLNSIGYVWSNWDTQYRKLAEYIREHGRAGWKTLHKDDENLYDWVFRQRLSYQNKQPRMTKERIDKLNAIGFIWVGQKNLATWETRLEQCRKFKETHGHLRVPFLHDPSQDGTEPNEEEKAFRIWAHSVCQSYKKFFVDKKKGNLSKKQLDELILMGFDFQLERMQEIVKDTFDVVFNHRVAQLKRVAELRGNCNDKKNIMEVYPERELMLFVRQQRRHYHAITRGEKTVLTPARMKMLEDIGFDFDPRRHYAPPKTTTYKNFKSYKLENNVYQEVLPSGQGNNPNYVPTSGVDESYDNTDDENYDMENEYL